MGVAAQRQTEMPDVVEAVGRLRLAAQYKVVDQWCFHGSGGAAQYAVEQLGLDRLPLSQCQSGNTGLYEKDAQRLDLLRIGRVVDAVHAGLPACLELLGGGDIRQDHELLNEAMAVQSVHALYCGGTSLGIEYNSILTEIELESATRGPRRGKHSVGPVERGKLGRRQSTWRPVVPSRLDLL